MGIGVFTSQVAIARRRSRTSPPHLPSPKDSNNVPPPQRKNGIVLKAPPPVNPMTDSGYYSQGVRSRSESGASQSSVSSETSVSSSDTSVTSSCSCDDCPDKETVHQPEVYYRAREEIHDDESWIVVDIKKIP